MFGLINELDPNHSGDLNHEEFILILKYIEHKNAKAPELSGSQDPSKLPSLNTSRMKHHDKSTMSQEASVYDIDKKKYGALLPKTGVYFLPDERIISFLK